MLGFRDLADYKRVPAFVGAVVGPMANRLSDGRARIDGHVVQMPRNEGGRNTLHSGPEGLHRRIWQLTQRTDASVSLRCTLPHGACGLPGHREISATYSLAGNALRLVLEARTDKTTLMNLTHHPYWAVDHRARLRVSAYGYLDVNSAKLPTGRVAPQAGSEFDLRRSGPIPAQVDHNFILADQPRETPKRAAWLETPDYGLRIDTTAAGLQVYSGSALPYISATRSMGRAIQPHSGIALEPQLWPDAPHHSGFPTAFLEPDMLWRQETHYILNF